MRLLLDASALLGVFYKQFPLGGRTRAEIANVATEVWVCPASAYEIEWKQRIGKLKAPPIPDWKTMLTARGYQISNLDLSHYVAATRLPMLHRDPWDRLLIALALSEGMTIASSDRHFAAYGVPVIW